MTPSRSAALVATLALAAALRAAEPPPAPAFTAETYASLGSAFAENSRLTTLGWKDAEFDAFIEGMRAAFRGQPFPADQRTQALHDAVLRRLQQAEAAATEARRRQFADPAQLEAYMREACKGLHLDRTDSGAAYSLLTRGGGSRPEPGDTVVVSYKVTAADGRTEIPTAAVQRRRCRVDELPPGLGEIVQMMTMSGAALVVLPPALSFGSGTWPPGTDPGTPLIFLFVLDEIVPAS